MANTTQNNKCSKYEKTFDPKIKRCPECNKKIKSKIEPNVTYTCKRCKNQVTHHSEHHSKIKEVYYGQQKT